MDKIDNWLWIGDASDGRNIAAMQQNGITACMNATCETDGWPEAFKAVTPYLRLEQQDGQAIPRPTIDRFVGFMAVQQARKAVTLIHCGAGVSRASTFSILWLMLRDRMSWEGAEALVRVSRPIIQPHPELKKSVFEWLQGHGFWHGRGS